MVGGRGEGERGERGGGEGGEGGGKGGRGGVWLARDKTHRLRERDLVLKASSANYIGLHGASDRKRMIIAVIKMHIMLG